MPCINTNKHRQSFLRLALLGSLDVLPEAQLLLESIKLLTQGAGGMAQSLKCLPIQG